MPIFRLHLRPHTHAKFNGQQQEPINHFAEVHAGGDASGSNPAGAAAPGPGVRMLAPFTARPRIGVRLLMQASRPCPFLFASPIQLHLHSSHQAIHAPFVAHGLCRGTLVTAGSRRQQVRSAPGKLCMRPGAGRAGLGGGSDGGGAGRLGCRPPRACGGAAARSAGVRRGGGRAPCAPFGATALPGAAACPSQPYLACGLLTAKSLGARALPSAAACYFHASASVQPTDSYIIDFVKLRGRMTPLCVHPMCRTAACYLVIARRTGSTHIFNVHLRCNDHSPMLEEIHGTKANRHGQIA